MKNKSIKNRIKATIWDETGCRHDLDVRGFMMDVLKKIYDLIVNGQMDMSENNEKLIRDKSTPENKSFWDHAEKVAADVETWPSWMKGKGEE